jgi:hypothetical protein
MKFNWRALTLSLVVITSLIVLGAGRSEAFYWAAAAGCGPQGCGAARARCGPQGCGAAAVGAQTTATGKRSVRCATEGNSLQNSRAAIAVAQKLTHL